MTCCYEEYVPVLLKKMSTITDPDVLWFILCHDVCHHSSPLGSPSIIGTHVLPCLGVLFNSVYSTQPAELCAPPYIQWFLFSCATSHSSFKHSAAVSALGATETLLWEWMVDFPLFQNTFKTFTHQNFLTKSCSWRSRLHIKGKSNIDLSITGYNYNFRISFVFITKLFFSRNAAK